MNSTITSATEPAGGLARTILLLRDHVRSACSDATIAAALTDVTVVIVVDTLNGDSADAQSAIIATALLVARSGASVSLALPDIPLRGMQAPVAGTHLVPGLSATLLDLIPGVVPGRVRRGQRYDVAIVIGDSTWTGRADRVIHLNADAWSGAISPDLGERWRSHGSPFGPLAAAGLAAGEVYKVAVRRLRHAAIDAIAFDLLFAPTKDARVRLAPIGTEPPTGALGDFDLVSGGAIIQSALFALARIPEVCGRGRIIEPERGDVSNLNRYALLLRSRIGAYKANDLAALGHAGLLGRIELRPIIARYDDVLAERLAPPAPHVLVGVDDIPSRWVVQSQRPKWLGVGATTHYGSMASFHIPHWGCARCLHPRDEPGNGSIPTVAFVSHWAGLWLASLFARAVRGEILKHAEQMVFMTSLRAESCAATWFSPVAADPSCEFDCAA